MNKIKETAKKMNQFVANLPDEINQSLVTAEHFITDLNRDQMLKTQTDVNDNNLPEYSSKNKAKKGLTFFNLFDTGDFQRQMFSVFNFPNYLITSKDRKLKKLITRVGERMFGIAKSRRQRAYQTSSRALGERFKRSIT